MKNKIAIIGPFPKPYGGISIHVSRVLSYIKAKGVPYEFYQENITRNPNKYVKFYRFFLITGFIKLFFTRYSVIHVHSTNKYVRIVFFIFTFLGKNVFLHLHGSSMKDTIESKGFVSYLFKKFIRFTNFISDNEEIEDFVNCYNPKFITTIDSFVPPLYNKDIFNKFQVNYEPVYKDKEFVISMIGWFKQYKNEDLYGFDIAAKAIGSLINKGYKVYLIASINGVIDQDIRDNFNNLIEKNKLEDHVFLIEEDLPEIWPIYIVSNVFIRPTNTDGLPLSIKESLWFETSVIASDCIKRPKNVILFKNRSADDLELKLLEVYKSQRNINFEYKIKKSNEKQFKYKLFEVIYRI